MTQSLDRAGGIEPSIVGIGAALATTLLFVPGDRPDRFSKALATEAGLVCMDLEDAVAPPDKDRARQLVLAFCSEAPPERLAIRINGPTTTPSGLADLLALAKISCTLPRLLLPKTEAPTELSVIASVLGDRGVELMPLVETAEGVANATEIGRQPGVTALMFGGVDFSRDIGSDISWEPLLYARAAIVQAAARAHVRAFDMPFLSLADPLALEAETVRIKALGFTGKMAIHPSQVPAINRIFQPTEDEIEEARAAVAAFQVSGGAAVQFRGRLLDAPMMPRYERVLTAIGD